jgi:DnaJ-class molecular chaperone
LGIKEVSKTFSHCSGLGWAESEAGKEVCEECKGCGVEWGDIQKKCDRCMGKGEIVYVVEEIWGLKTCSMCDGSRVDYISCPRCHGQGWVLPILSKCYIYM